MRHKISIEERLERLESRLKKVDFYMRRREDTNAQEQLAMILEDIENIRTLLRNETQD